MRLPQNHPLRKIKLLVEEIEFHLAYRWFIGLQADEPVWYATVFTKNRDRLLNSDIEGRFFREIVGLIDRNCVASDEHFSVDGTLLEA